MREIRGYVEKVKVAEYHVLKKKRGKIFRRPENLYILLNIILQIFKNFVDKMQNFFYNIENIMYSCL